MNNQIQPTHSFGRIEHTIKADDSPDKLENVIAGTDSLRSQILPTEEQPPTPDEAIVIRFSNQAPDSEKSSAIGKQILGVEHKI